MAGAASVFAAVRRARGVGWWEGDGPAYAAATLVFGVVVLLPPAVLLLGWLRQAYIEGLVVLAWSLPSPRGLGLLANSLLYALAVAALATLLGTGLAVWIRGGGFWQRLASRAYLLPLLIPPYLHALAWLSVGGRRQGIDQLLSLLVGADRVTVSSYGFWPAAFVLAFSLAPVLTLLALMGLESLEPELVEQAYLLREPWGTARRVLLPLLAPSLVAGAGLVFVIAMVEYGVPSVLQFNVYVMESYASFSQDNDPIRAAATVVPLVVPAVVLLVGSQMALRDNPLRGRAGRAAVVSHAAWPGAARLAVKASALGAAAVTAGSIAVLLLRTGSPATVGTSVATAWAEVLLSLGVAAATATGSMVISVPLALALLRRVRTRTFGWLLCALPLAIPAPLTGIALIHLTSTPWLDWAYGTPLPLAWAHAARLLPFGVFAASTQVRRIDPLLVDAASLHNVGRWRRFTAVRLPLLAPALVLSWLVVFVLSLGELGASLMVAPPGSATLPMRIYNLLHYGATDTVAGLSLVLLGIAGTTGALVLAWGRGTWPRRR